MTPVIGKRVVGLELDTGIARAVEMAGKPGSPSLVHLGSIPLPGGVVKEGMIIDPEQVGLALKEYWNRVGFRERNVLLGVSNQGVLVRHITVPKVPLNKLKNIIHFQAQEYLPIPVESVVLDFLVLDEIEGESEAEKQLEVLLVAARRDMLDSFLKALEIAQLDPVDVDVSSMAMIRLLPEKAMQMTIAMVNVANGLNSILVSSNGKPRLARLGLVKIVDLAESLGCTIDNIFKACSINPDSTSAITNSWINSLAVEIRSSLTYYQDLPGSSRVEGILLSGRGARFANVAELLDQYLELPVRIFNPLKAYPAVARKLAKTKTDVLDYATSTGLALRGLEAQ
jgi:type IV pilus assembly protein PilM